MKLEALMEGILFALGGSAEIKALAQALAVSEKEAREAAGRLEMRLAEEDSGLKLVYREDRLQLGTKPDCYEPLIRLAARPRKPVLTNVVLETLAIIAYRQPITKLEIEKIRGVSSDHAVNRLIEYDLVTEVGRLEAPGRPILFGTTEEVLRRFGVSSTDALPELSAEKLAELQEEAERESAESPEDVPVSI